MKIIILLSQDSTVQQLKLFWTSSSLFTSASCRLAKRLVKGAFRPWVLRLHRATCPWYFVTLLFCWQRYHRRAAGRPIASSPAPLLGKRLAPIAFRWLAYSFSKAERAGAIGRWRPFKRETNASRCIRALRL